MTRNLTLELERLITNHRYRDIAAAVLGSAPKNLADQNEAAAHHATELVLQISTKPGPFFGSLPRDTGNTPDWLTLGVADTIAGFLNGHGSTCVHNPAPENPQPLWAAAWRPGLVTCTRCKHHFAMDDESVPANTCDGCGHYCTGPEHGDGIYPGVFKLGQFIYLYGVCGDCRY